MIELLSPAGSPEAVIAAVQNGADAVYMGMGNFNARRGAKNFTDEEFERAVRYCHVRGCKVYVTLNTLINDREVEPALQAARLASEVGTDGIIIQDLGLIAAVRQYLPDIPLHASTQMSIHNLPGVEAAAELAGRCASATRASATCRPSSGREAATAACAPSPAASSILSAGAWMTTPCPSRTTVSSTVYRRSRTRGSHASKLKAA